MSATVCTAASLEQALRQAHQVALRTGLPVPVSWVQPWAGAGPDELWRLLHGPWAARLAPRLRLRTWGWEQPPVQPGPVELVAAGACARFDAGGPGRFALLRRSWDSWRKRLVVFREPADTAGDGGQQAGEALAWPVPALWVGGFAFAPSAENLQAGDAGGPGLACRACRVSPQWQDFGDARFWWPELLWAWCGAAAWLAVAGWVQPDSDPEALACAWQARVQAVRLPPGRHPSRTPPGSLPVPGPGPDGSPGKPKPSSGAPAGSALRLDESALAGWTERVHSALREIACGELDKVVLGACLHAESERPFDPVRLWQALAQQLDRGCLFAVEPGSTCFAGATPERLACVQGDRVLTGALASSAPARPEPFQGELTLLQHPKQRHEHQLVVGAVRASLQALCRELEAAGRPRVVPAGPLQHLYTPVRGRLLPGTTIWEVVERLHPTPAVAGEPREAALAWLARHEGLQRGWYSGGVGWVDGEGQGEFWVALRCGLVEGQRATLFAGCGIVEQSDPAAEQAELRLKFQVMLRALAHAARDGERR